MSKFCQKMREMVDESTKNEKRDILFGSLHDSLPTQNYRRSPLVTSRHRELDNKKVINLFLLSLSAQPPCSLGAVEKLLSLTLSIIHIPLSLFFVCGH